MACKQDRSYIGTVISSQPLFGYRHVVFYLALKDLSDIIKIDSISKINYTLYRKALSVSQSSALLYDRLLQHHLTVSFDRNNIGVKIDYTHACFFITFVCVDNDIEDMTIVYMAHLDLSIPEICLHLFDLFF